MFLSPQSILNPILNSLRKSVSISSSACVFTPTPTTHLPDSTPHYSCCAARHLSFPSTLSPPLLMEMCALSVWLHSPPPLHLHSLYHPQWSGPCCFILPEWLLLRCPWPVCCALPMVYDDLQSLPVFLEPLHYQDCSPSSGGIISVSSSLCFSIPWGSLCGPLFFLLMFVPWGFHPLPSLYLSPGCWYFPN